MNKKILLIDDSVTIHRVIDLCVDKEKYDVVKVFSKDEAAAALKTEKPDMVLLDNKLADVKTIDMVQTIKESCPGCYVILLAGAFDQFDKEQCDETGADDFIYKPFDAKTLDAKIVCGMGGVCPDPAADSVSDAEMKAVMDELEEEVDMPDFDTDDMVPVDETAEDDEPAEKSAEPAADNAEADAAAEETISLADIDDLAVADEDAQPDEQIAEPADEVPSDPDSFDMDSLDMDSLMPETEDEPEQAAEETAVEEPMADEPMTDEAGAEPDAEPELDDIQLPEEISSSPFEGLVEADEADIEKEAVQKQEQPEKNSGEEAEQPEESAGADELDGILNDITEETKDTGDIDEAETTITRSEQRIDAENAFDGVGPEPVPQSGRDGEPEPETIDLSAAVGDEVAEKYEDVSEDDMSDISEPDAADDMEEDVPEMTVRVDAEEPEKKPVTISEEKLVEAVYEAIDEDTLKYAIKEVLADKISRILEDELPYLVEKAIRKEIERLVKAK